MYEENKKSSQKTASQLPMTATASEEVSQVKSKKTKKAVIHSKLSKEEVPRTLKKSGRSNPSPVQPVTGADDFFMKDHLRPVDVSGKRRDRDRRWNSGLSRNVKPSHPMKGHVSAKQRQQKSSGANFRPVRSAFGGDQDVHPQRKCRTGNDKRLGMKKSNPGKETLSSANHTKMEGTREITNMSPSQGRNHVDASDHELDPENFTSDKEGGDDRSGFDSDMTYFISDSDLGLSGPSKENVSSGESHDSTDESDSTENSSGSSREQDHSDALYDSVESDSSSDSSDDDDDDNESTEPSDDGNFSDGSHSDDSFDSSDEDEDEDNDEGNFSDGSHSDDSFDGSDEDEDEDDSDHLYNNFSSDDSESDEEYYDELEEDSEEHIYDDPDDLYCSDHIYEDPDDSLYDSV